MRESVGSAMAPADSFRNCRRGRFILFSLLELTRVAICRAKAWQIATRVSSRRENKMKRPRRQFLKLSAGAIALPTLSRIARAQAYPARPVTVIVPFAAGG